MDAVKHLIKTHCPGLVSVYRQLRKRKTPLRCDEVLATVFGDIQSTTPDVFFVEIGAMDGISFDPLYRYVTRYGWRGLLVEPLPDQFEQLRRNYEGHQGLSFENVAIADEPCIRPMYRIDPDAVKRGLVPDWARGISSFFNDRNALGGLRVPAESYEQMRPHITTETVSCDSLANVLRRHRVRKIDVFVTDVEGYDYQVLRQFDFGQFSPSVILMEWYNLPHDERRLSLSLLRKHDYRTVSVWEGCVENLLAWRGINLDLK